MLVRRLVKGDTHKKVRRADKRTGPSQRTSNHTGGWRKRPSVPLAFPFVCSPKEQGARGAESKGHAGPHACVGAWRGGRRGSSMDKCTKAGHQHPKTARSKTTALPAAMPLGAHRTLIGHAQGERAHGAQG